MSIALPLRPMALRSSFTSTTSTTVIRRSIATGTTITITPMPSILSSSSVSSSSFRILLPNSLFAKSTTSQSVISAIISPTQRRHATLLRRPKRPYTFTQLVTLSDGSTFIHRTTSPTPIYRSTRDTRNTLLWNPSSQKLLTVEDDEAGRLAAFRARFGRAWDSSSSSAPTAATPTGSGATAESATTQLNMSRREESAEAPASATSNAEQAKQQAQLDADIEEEEEDLLLDLISSYGQEELEGSSSKKGDKKK